MAQQLTQRVKLRFLPRGEPGSGDVGQDARVACASLFGAASDI
jgi:hypothetical protein